MNRFLLLAVAVLAFVGCNNAFEDEGNVHFEQNTLPTLMAGVEDADTRTYVEDNFYLRRHEGDLISAFLGNTLNNKYIFKGETGENSGTFSAVSSAELGSSYPLDNIYAIYPYNENTEMSKAGVISTLLPAEQTYAEDSFGRGANTMVAVTENLEDTFLSFKNVGGYLKVKLYSDAAAVVKSIAIRGNNGEKISGAATVAMTYGETPQLTMATGATGSITLDCGEGVMLSSDAENPTEFWVVVPPMEFSKGITIVATDINNGTFVQNTSKKVVVEHNMIQPMSAIEVEFDVYDPTKPAKNEIWYTSTDGEIVTPNTSNVFGATIVSNTYENGRGVITFHSDVTQIGERAFYDCNSLTSVTIPDSVTTIGDKAFYDCDSLTSITIPDSVTTIGDGAFQSCKSLTSVTIPDSVTTIGDKAFSKCYSLTSVTIPDSVTTIGYWVFEFCLSLTSVTIGDSVTTIGDLAFAYCDSLTSVTIPDSVTTIGDSAFSGCDSLTSVTIGDSVTTLGGGAFAGCSLIKEFKGKFAEDNGRCLIVDNTLIAYANKSGTEYTIPDCVTTIGDYAFCECYSLTSVTIPDSVTTIGYGAFDGCKSLTSVTIGDSVTTIGEKAFYSCKSLTSITIPDSVTTIGGGAFAGCPLIKEFKGKYATDNGRCLIKDNTIIAYAEASGTEYTIPDIVTTIGDEAFYWCGSLTSVTIGDSVTTIGYRAFFDCNSLTSVTIPDSVTTIGGDAFYYCHSLTSVYCKATTPPTMDSNIFTYAPLEAIYVPTASVNDYKTAYSWRDYASYIVGYDF